MKEINEDLYEINNEIFWLYIFNICVILTWNRKMRDCCYVKSLHNEFKWKYLPVPKGMMANGGDWHTASWHTLSKQERTQPTVPSPPQTKIL